MITQTAPPALTANPEFARLASDAQVERAAKALEARGFRTFVAASGEAARQQVHEWLEPGAQVFDATSRTLDTIGLSKEIHAGGIPYDAVRPRLFKMDRQTQQREMRQLGSAPDYVVGSVHAVTEDGVLLAASYSGSQLAAYASGAGKVIFVVGAQKIVPDLETGLRRIREYSYPMEDARARQAYGMGSRINKTLIMEGDLPDRTSVVLVKEQLGF
jgi:hypothetical protein